jgi:hypothetical protein
MQFRKVVFWSVMIGALALIQSPARAQVNWSRTENRNSISLEWSKIHLTFDPHEDIYTFLTTIGFLSGQYRISNNVSIVGEIPFSTYDAGESMPVYYNLDEIYFDYLYWEGYYEDHQMLGNPYLGIEAGSKEKGPILTAGVRFPLASDDNYPAASVGVLGAYDRFEAFVPDLWSFYCGGGYRDFSHPVFWKINFGPAFLVPERGDAELLADYSIMAGIQQRRYKIGISMTGRCWLSESDLDFSERIDHIAGMVAALRLGNFEPGVQVRYNLDDDINEPINYTYGLNLTVNLGSAGSSQKPQDWEE